MELESFVLQFATTELLSVHSENTDPDNNEVLAIGHPPLTDSNPPTAQTGDLQESSRKCVLFKVFYEKKRDKSFVDNCNILDQVKMTARFILRWAQTKTQNRMTTTMMWPMCGAGDPEENGSGLEITSKTATETN